MKGKNKRKLFPLFLGNCLDADEWVKVIELNNPTDNIARFASFIGETCWRHTIYNNNPYAFPPSYELR